LGSNFNFY